MTWLFVIVVILLLGAGFLLVLGLLGELPEAEPDLRPDTIDGEPVFDVALRGYRMDEVDAQLVALHERIAALQAHVDGAGLSAPSSPDGPDAAR